MSVPIVPTGRDYRGFSTQSGEHHRTDPRARRSIGDSSLPETLAGGWAGNRSAFPSMSKGSPAVFDFPPQAVLPLHPPRIASVCAPPWGLSDPAAFSRGPWSDSVRGGQGGNPDASGGWGMWPQAHSSLEIVSRSSGAVPPARPKRPVMLRTATLRHALGNAPTCRGYRPRRVGG